MEAFKIIPLIKFKVSFILVIILNVIPHKVFCSNNGFEFYQPPGIGIGGVVLDNYITIDNNAIKLICTNNGLVRFNNALNTWDTLRNLSSGTNRFKQVAVDANNTYWIATKDKGLWSYDGNIWTIYQTSNSNIISNSLNCVFVFGTNVYVGSSIGFSININGNFINYKTSNSNLCNDTVNAINIDNNNNLYIGTNNGLSKFDGINFITFNSLNSGLLDNTVLSLYFDGTDIWIGTQTKSLHRLSNNIIKNIQEIFDTPIRFYDGNAQTKSIYSICLGPHGGVCISGGNARIIEIFQNTIYTYDYLIRSSGMVSNGIFAASGSKVYLSYDYINELIWISGNFNNLASFKLSESIELSIYNSYNNYKALEINNTKAAIGIRGNMFSDQLAQVANYEIPKNSGKYAINHNELWFNGIEYDSSKLHIRCRNYRDYQPGPLDTITGLIDTAMLVKFDRIWKVSWFDIEQFKYFFQTGEVQNGTWSPSLDIISWPTSGVGNYTKNMAPFVDVNQNGVYDPIHDGDYPNIKGDQMLFWVFNDLYRQFYNYQGFSYGGIPLKMEIHASAYSFSCPELTNADSAINYTTFYNYKIFNRSGVNYDSCYIGNLTDYNLGDPSDDKVACNPLNNLSFCYNGNLNDGSGEVNSYGANPPVIGNTILNGPKAYPNDGKDNDNNGTIDETNEKCLMNSSIFYNNSTDTIFGAPTKGYQFANYLKGRWRNGTPLTYGNDGIGGTLNTPFMFSGTYQDTVPWYPSSIQDYKCLQGTGPFSFPANSSIDYDFAIVYARDTVGNDSPQLFQQLFDNAARAKSWFNDNTFPSCVGPNKIKAIETELNHLEVFPNPANEIINFKSTNKRPVLSYTIYNAMGKAIVSNTNVNTNEIYITHFAKGIYFLQLKFVDGKSSTQKFIKN